MVVFHLVSPTKATQNGGTLKEKRKDTETSTENKCARGVQVQLMHFEAKKEAKVRELAASFLKARDCLRFLRATVLLVWRGGLGEPHVCKLTRRRVTVYGVPESYGVRASSHDVDSLIWDPSVQVLELL